MKIKNCRSCSSKSLKKLYSLGNQYLTGIFPKNIAVGKVYKIEKGEVFVKPFVNFNKLDFVSVVTEKKR